MMKAVGYLVAGVVAIVLASAGHGQAQSLVESLKGKHIQSVTPVARPESCTKASVYDKNRGWYDMDLCLPLPGSDIIDILYFTDKAIFVFFENNADDGQGLKLPLAGGTGRWKNSSINITYTLRPTATGFSISGEYYMPPSDVGSSRVAFSREIVVNGAKCTSTTRLVSATATPFKSSADMKYRLKGRHRISGKDQCKLGKGRA